MLRVSVIVNPNAGPARRRRPAREAVVLAERIIGHLGAEPRILVASGAGAGRDAALAELSRGTDVVCAWGGDGTINEVASAVVERDGILAIVPTGSGNGLARELGIPAHADEALRLSVSGADRRIDAAEFDGRLFFNVAGLGLDAAIAHAFAVKTGRRRGLASYLLAVVHGLFTHVPARYDLTIDGVERPAAAAAMVTVANSRQWGNGAVIAPGARPDDGWLDVAFVGETRPLVIAARMWRLLNGTIDRMPGVSLTRGRTIRIAANREVPVHLDGEPAGATRASEIRVRPGALRVKVQARGGTEKR